MRSDPFSFLLRAAARGKLQPIALVDERNGQQQHSEYDEADDAVAAVELRDVVDEDLDGRGGDENESLPAHETAAPSEIRRSST